MGLFSGIIDNIKDIGSYISDIGINFLGNVIDMFKPDKVSSVSYEPSSGSSYTEYDYQDDIYDDYRDWIFEIDS